MQFWRLDIAYCGSNFSGFQRQDKKRTVQGEIEHILEKLYNQKITIKGSGRTDLGTHALKQVVSFTTLQDLYNQATLYRALCSLINKDIALLNLLEVKEDFHARFDTCGKTYIYCVYLGKLKNPFLVAFSWQYNYPLDTEKLSQVCSLLEGEHNFVNFCRDSEKYQGKTTRHLHRCQVELLDKFALFIFSGSGFLHKMVRMLTSHILDSASSKRDVAPTAELLQKKTKKLTTKEIAPAKGLFLADVFYDEQEYFQSLKTSPLTYLKKFYLF